MTTSAEVRKALVDTLTLDLVGPSLGHPLAAEQLWESEPPSRWYLTGFLMPTKAPESQRFDPTSVEGIDTPVAGDDGGGPSDDGGDGAGGGSTRAGPAGRHATGNRKRSRQ